jgi:hypothetical protein
MANLDSVSCLTASFCVIGGAGSGPGSSSPSLSSVSVDGGLTWGAAVTAGGPAALGPVDCSTMEHCVGLIGSDATDTEGLGQPVVSVNGGQSWVEGTSVIGSSVSCIANTCLSVGARYATTMVFTSTAFSSTDGGETWSPLTLPQSTAILTSVACTTSSDCVVVGNDGPNGSQSVIWTYRP